MFDVAKDVSLARVEEIDPDWMVLVDTEIFHDPRFASLFGGYVELIRELEESGAMKYQKAAEFFPGRVWGAAAGFLYREYAGFRIIVFRKNGGKVPQGV